MRNFYLFLLALLSGFCLASCSDEGDNNSGVYQDAYARFLKKNIAVNSTGSSQFVLVEWHKTAWEITAGKGDILKDFQPITGGNDQAEKQYTKIQLICQANISAQERTQSVFLTDKANGTVSELVLTQEKSIQSVKLQLNPSVKYQPVLGFGGMYNPKIWCGNNLLSNAELNKMYGPNGLGYSILRLMIYPNERDWEADVEAAKLVQANGGIVFACPWDCTDALAEKIQWNGKEVKHLKPSNYEAYAKHLVKYIQFMKNQGVNLYAVSMQNEPDMEFTFWKPAEVVTFIKQYGAMIRGTGVKLMGPEACGMQPEYTNPVLQDAEAFAQTDLIAGHLYQGFLDVESSSYVKNRHDYICGLYPKLQGKTWWMTEHLFNDGEREKDPSKWLFQKWSYCLNHLGREMHGCMEGYCSAYIYWYLKRFYGLMGDNDARSPVSEGVIAKNGYIMAHYAQYASRTTRIQAASDKKGVLVTAYVNEAETEVTLVLLNVTNASQYVEIPLAATSASAVLTDENRNMQSIAVDKIDGNYAVLLSAGSIVSVRLKLS